jgi:glycosyltransferase involved in cell wall biosynthesis
VDFLWAEAHDRSAAWGKLLTRYPAYYRLALRALSQVARQPYDLVIAWEAKVGVPFALARRLHRGPVPPFVLLAFNPGDVPGVFQPLIRLGMRGVDHCTVLARAEAEAYARRYAIPANRITVSALPSYDLLHDVQRRAMEPPYGGAPYLHASGRSSRDYATLVQAVAGLDVKVVIHGRGYNFKGLTLPANVDIGEFASQAEFQRLVYHALFEIVPLQPRLRPAGSSQVVFAMMMGKPVVATRNASLVDFVDHGVTGLLVAPQDVSALRGAILDLLEHPEDVTRMGAAARQRYEQRHTFEQFARNTRQVLLEIHQAAQKPE